MSAGFATKSRAEIPPSSGLTLGTKIVARWLGDPSYLDPAGAPRPLPRTPHKGGAESFAALVEKVSTNVRPRSVLDELVRLGVVEIDAEDRVHLVTRGFVPGKELDAKAFYFGEAMHDHLAAAVDNLGGSKPAWLERSVYYDELSPAAVQQLAEKSERLSMQVLQEINRDGMALEASDPPSPEQRMRMRLGVYFYAEPVPQPPTADAPKPAPRKHEQERQMKTTPAIKSIGRWLLHASLGDRDRACSRPAAVAASSQAAASWARAFRSVRSGAVTAIGSVTVNGVRFTTAAASVTIDGSPAPETALKVGMVVTVQGQLFPDGTATAKSVDARTEVKGIVTGVDSAARAFTVLGQRVRTDQLTVFAGGTFDTLLNQYVEVSGFRGAPGRSAGHARRDQLDDRPRGAARGHRHRGGVRPGGEDVRDRRPGGRFLAGGCRFPPARARERSRRRCARHDGELPGAGSWRPTSASSRRRFRVREFEGGGRRRRHRIRESGELPRQRAADRRPRRNA